MTTESTASIRKRLIVLAWPLMVTSMLMFVDVVIARYWMGKKLGAEGIAVHGATAQTAALAGLVFGAIGTGCAVTVARSVGARDGQGRSLIASALVLVGVTWMVVFGAMLVIAPHLAPRLGQAAAPAAAIEQYLVWWCGIAIPAMGAAMVIASAAAGAGLTKFALSQAVANIAITLVLLPLFLDAGVGYRAPALTATCAALVNAAQLWVRLRRVATDHHLGTAADRGIVLSGKTWLSILDIGLPAQLSRATAWIVMIFTMTRVAEAGRSILAGYAVAMALVDVAGGAAGGFSGGVQILMGQSLGAKDPQKARRVLSVGLAMSLAVPLVAAALYVSFAPALVGLITDAPDAQETGVRALRIMVFVLFAGAVWQVFLQAFAAAKATKRVLVVTLVAQALAFGIASIWNGERLWGAFASIGAMYALSVVFYALLAIPVLWRGALAVPANKPS